MRTRVLALVPRLVEFGPPPWRDAPEMTATDLDVIAAALRSEGDDPAVLVSELEGRVVGFIHLHSKTDYYRRRAHGHVADLVVAEGCEGRGIAGRLLAEAEHVGAATRAGTGSRSRSSARTSALPGCTSTTGSGGTR